MIVYRLERNGWGVFCRLESKISLPFSSDALYSNYGYTCSTRYRGDCNYRSGCESIDKLIEYFGSDFAYMLEQGARIVAYVVNKPYVHFSLNPDEFDEMPDESIEVIFDLTKAKERIIVLEGKDSADFREEDKSKEMKWDIQQTLKDDSSSIVYSLTLRPATLRGSLNLAGWSAT